MNKQISFFDKPIIVILENNTKFHKDFIKGAEFQLFMEQEENYIIYHCGVFYGLIKNECRKVIF